MSGAITEILLNCGTVWAIPVDGRASPTIFDTSGPAEGFVVWHTPGILNERNARNKYSLLFFKVLITDIGL
jgi:hypothetical protein